jgi:hypothetical protein
MLVGFFIIRSKGKLAKKTIVSATGSSHQSFLEDYQLRIRKKPKYHQISMDTALKTIAALALLCIFRIKLVRMNNEMFCMPIRKS